MNTNQRGDMAAAHIIADLTSKGIVVFAPVVSNHMPFDLIGYGVENGTQKVLRIQCKYSSTGLVRPGNSCAWRKIEKCRKYKPDDFDYYAIYLPTVNRVIYPSIAFAGRTIRCVLPNSSTPFLWYEDFLTFTQVAQPKSYKDFGVQLHTTHHKGQKHKITWPNNDVLRDLVWSKPIRDIALDLGVSDRAVVKHCSRHGIDKPPQGYWLRKQS